MKKKTLMSWSTGKDSAWTYYQLQKNSAYDVVGLLCTVNQKFARTAMHGVRIELLKLQAQMLDMPLDIVEIPYPCTNSAYEQIMSDYIQKVKKQDINYFAFGDLFLEDIRDYRIKQLENTGIEAVFPIWNTNTKILAQQIINEGFETIITCIDSKKLDKSFVGRLYNQSFLDDLPENIDPCGENGEFHTFVFNAPMFEQKIPISVGEIVQRGDFIFADIQSIAIK
jgi:uncharacterized protein (TIGR00290 family)